MQNAFALSHKKINTRYFYNALLMRCHEVKKQE